MNISNIGQTIATISTQIGKSIPSQPEKIIDSSFQDESSTPRTIDMRNVSVNEINELIKSGVEGLLDFVPLIPPQTVKEYGSESAANIKIDYLGQIERSIEFKKSVAEDTSFLKEVLEKIKNIDGMAMPQKIDITV